MGCCCSCCCCCCKDRGKVHGYVGPPQTQPVAVTTIITQPAPITRYPPYSAATYSTTMPQPQQQPHHEMPPAYSEHAASYPTGLTAPYPKIVPQPQPQHYETPPPYLESTATSSLGVHQPVDPHEDPKQNAHFNSGLNYF